MDEINLLVIMTDEMRRDTLGCYENEIVQTPHIDSLAMRGVQFENAYTPSLICVPERASIASGQYFYEHRCWAKAIPYHGQIDSWHHGLRNAGRRSATIGKLHFRGAADDNGFTEEIKPLMSKMERAGCMDFYGNAQTSFMRLVLFKTLVQVKTLIRTMIEPSAVKLLIGWKTAQQIKALLDGVHSYPFYAHIIRLHAHLSSVLYMILNY